jgi:hypothetical protein
VDICGAIDATLLKAFDHGAKEAYLGKASLDRLRGRYVQTERCTI